MFYIYFAFTKVHWQVVCSINMCQKKHLNQDIRNFFYTTLKAFTGKKMIVGVYKSKRIVGFIGRKTKSALNFKHNK